MARVAFTREGWYCLFVIVFVLGGAALREVNLLIVLAGLMIGPLIFHWRMVTLMLRKVHVSRSASERVRAGDVLTASVTVRNGRRFVDCWAIVVYDSVKMVGGSQEDYANVGVLVPHVAPQSQEKGIYQATLTRRGRYLLGPLLLTTRFPLGLIAARQRIDSLGHVIVCPRTGQLTVAWRHLMESERLGAEQTRARKGMNEDGEFFGLREWRPGDAQRLVHWRTSAKLGTLAVRQFEQQHFPDVALVVDLWRDETESSAAPLDDAHRLATETAISFAATIVDDIAQTGHVKLRIAVAGAAPHCWTGVASPLMAEEILDCLAEIQPGDGEQLKVALGEMLGKQGREHKIVVISTRSRQDVLENMVAGFMHRPEIEWIDVSAGEHQPYFKLRDDSTTTPQVRGPVAVATPSPETPVATAHAETTETGASGAVPGVASRSTHDSTRPEGANGR